MIPMRAEANIRFLKDRLSDYPYAASSAQGMRRILVKQLTAACSAPIGNNTCIWLFKTAEERDSFCEKFDGKPYAFPEP